ncbi:MAG TPA: hypothetical protein V6D20_15435 [Candidatus Obscuribacterales bacterium]
MLAHAGNPFFEPPYPQSRDLLLRVESEDGLHTNCIVGEYVLFGGFNYIHAFRRGEMKELPPIAIDRGNIWVIRALDNKGKFYSLTIAVVGSADGSVSIWSLLADDDVTF